MKCETQQLTSDIIAVPAASQVNPQPPSDIFHDPRLRALGWRDLVRVSPFEVLLETLLPAGWLAASLLTATYGLHVVALGFSFMFFLTGLRLIHNAFHCSLGLSRRTTDIVLWVMSLVMLGSMHAVQFNHMRHHRRTFGEDDAEGSTQRCRLGAPYFSVRPFRSSCMSRHFDMAVGRCARRSSSNCS